MGHVILILLSVAWPVTEVFWIKKLGFFDESKMAYISLVVINAPLGYIAGTQGLPLSTFSQFLTPLILYIFHRRFTRTIVCSFLITSFAFVSEVFVVNPIIRVVVIIFDINYNYLFYHIALLRFTATAPLATSLMFLTRKFIRGREDIADRNIMLPVVLNFIIIYVIGQVEATAYMFLLWAVINLILLAVVVLYVIKENDIKAQKLINDATKIYIKDLEDSHNSLRTIKHDYINILTSFKVFIDTGDYVKLKEYYYKELAELNRHMIHDDRIVIDLHNVKISEIKSILIYKCGVAVSKKINTHIEVREPIEAVCFSTAMLCQILGIFLDNAIDANGETSKKELFVSIINDSASVTFIVKNTWKSIDISIKQMFELGFSTKYGNRGIGLFTVINYVNKAKNITLDTNVDQDYFTQALTVHN